MIVEVPQKKQESVCGCGYPLHRLGLRGLQDREAACRRKEACIYRYISQHRMRTKAGRRYNVVYNPGYHVPASGIYKVLVGMCYVRCVRADAPFHIYAGFTLI